MSDGVNPTGEQFPFVILVVEDNDYMGDVLVKALKRIGFPRTVPVKSVKDAVETLRNSSKPGSRGGEVCDIVIADLVTPPVNANHLLHWVRNDKASPNRFLPFIVLSGAADRANVVETRDLGSNLFTAKPFSIEKLFKAVQRIIDAPRQFVMTQSYFGPDRRIAAKDAAVPPTERRRPDEKHATVVFTDSRVEKASQGTKDSEVWLFKLPNRLKQTLGSSAMRTEFHIPDHIIDSAQGELKREGAGFLDWAKSYLDTISTEVEAAKGGAGGQDAAFVKVNFIAHELRGQGGTFGFPLITAFAKSLYQATTPPCRTDDAGAEIVNAHVDTLRAVIREKIGGDGGEIGKQLYMGLRQAIAKYGAAG